MLLQSIIPNHSYSKGRIFSFPRYTQYLAVHYNGIAGTGQVHVGGVILELQQEEQLEGSDREVKR